ncbi:MAG: hypothetical protein R3B90_05585 [Planctomycetaceae bacterium]
MPPSMLANLATLQDDREARAIERRTIQFQHLQRLRHILDQLRQRNAANAAPPSALARHSA